MAHDEHVRVLKQGSEAWNAWRMRNGLNIEPRLSDADLSDANLINANLSRGSLIGANLSGAKLVNANLAGAKLSKASFVSANLTGADLSDADLFDTDLNGANLNGANFSAANLTHAALQWTDLNGADLSDADLVSTNLTGADLTRTNFGAAKLIEVILSDVDLSTCKNLDSILHRGPSTVDIRTLERSGPLPLVFLRGVGLPDKLIEYLPSLLGRAIEFYSCFISYSTKDEEFLHRLYADLQNKGVRCWFAPEDMKIGAKILDTLDKAIRFRDKLLLVLSEASIGSEWVEDEVTKAFAEDRRREMTVLFPSALMTRCSRPTKPGRASYDTTATSVTSANGRIMTRISGLLTDCYVICVSRPPDATSSDALRW